IAQYTPAIPGVMLPEIPGGVSTGDFATLSSFGFLEEIRPLFTYPLAWPLPTVPTMPNVSIPGEAEVRSLANGLCSTATPQVPDSIADFSSPQVPGSVTSHRGSARTPSVYP